jgi:hypothetical protein
MKKLILSSVFAGLVLAGSAVEASTAAAPEKKAPYGKFVINGDFAAGWWSNLLITVPQADGTEKIDGIDKDDFTKRNLVALSDAKLSFKTECGCSAVAFGSVAKLDLNPAALTRKYNKEPKGFDFSGIFRDVYVFGRFGNMVEVRIGSQRDAMYSLVDGADVMGGTRGYNGSWSALLKSTADADGVVRKDRWVMDLVHANDTFYTNKLEVRTVRMAGIQAVANWTPSSAYNGRLGTYGDGKKTNGAQNNLVSLGLNYDNTFGDIRMRASAGGVYGISDKTTDTGAAIADQAASFTYRLGGIFSWKTFDVGLGWLDNRSTGFAGTNKEKNAGKVLHGALGYQFDSTTWKPRVSAGVMWGWKNGKNKEDEKLNEFTNQDQTIAISGAVDLNIRDGFRWFLEGTFAMLDESNANESAKDANQKNLIVGTGLAVSQ